MCKMRSAITNFVWIQRVDDLIALKEKALQYAQINTWQSETFIWDIDIFYFTFKGSTVVLLHGYTKKTEKAPTSELDKAMRYKEDYERRCDEWAKPV